MDKTVPKPAAMMLDFIGGVEAPRGYGTLYGNNQGKLDRPLVSMTIGEILAAGPGWAKRFGSSACGRYQFMAGRNHTLQGLKNELGLRDSQVFNPDLQDRLAYHLLRRRGYDMWASGEMTDRLFMLNLAKEWASLPVPYEVRGGSRVVQRGQSYYAGDGLNKSLVKPEHVEGLLAEARKMVTIPEVTAPPPLDTDPTPDDPVMGLWAALTKAFMEYMRARKEKV